MNRIKLLDQKQLGVGLGSAGLAKICWKSEYIEIDSDTLLLAGFRRISWGWAEVLAIACQTTLQLVRTRVNEPNQVVGSETVGVGLGPAGSAKICWKSGYIEIDWDHNY